MVAYVLCHGWHDSGAPQIVVPQGMTISFMAGPDLSGVEHVQAAQLFVGGVGAAETYNAGDPLPNYEFEQLSDASIARLTGLNIHDLDLWFVNAALPAFALCTGVAGDCTADVHVCQDGLLGIAQARPETHLHVMSCRVDVAQDPATWQADLALHDGQGGADTSFDTELVQWTSWFMGLGFEQQRTAWEALSYEEKLQRTTDAEMAEWADVFETVQQFESEGPGPAFNDYYDKQSGAVRERVLRDYPAVAAAVRARPEKQIPDGYQDIIEQFVLTAPADQDTYWRDLEPAMRELFVLDPRVNDWAQAYTARQYLGAMSPDAFRQYCAKLSDGAVDILLTYDNARAIISPGA